MNIQEFIKANIESIDELRSLLLFYSAPGLARNAEEIAGKLYITPAAAAKVLARLAARKFVAGEEEPPRYRFLPQTPEQLLLLKELEDLDRQRPVTLIKMIYERPTDVQAFANAFKLKKDT